MNIESKSVSQTQGTQSGKSTSYKRAHRASKKPLLVTETEQSSVAETTIEETSSASAFVEVEESAAPAAKATKQRGPKFFANVETEKVQGQAKADPITARLGRALRGKSSNAALAESAPAKKTPANTLKSTAPERPKSGFKTRHIMGMAG